MSNYVFLVCFCLFVRFCLFLSALVCFCLFISVSLLYVRFSQLLSNFVHFCLFYSIYVCFCLCISIFVFKKSVSVNFCLFLSVYVRLRPFLSILVQELECLPYAGYFLDNHDFWLKMLTQKFCILKKYKIYD